MPDMDPRIIAERFARALDRCDFAEAGRYLSTDCHYQTGHEELIGPEAVLASYSENAEWASRALERVVYESEIEAGAGSNPTVLFIDRITQGGHIHEYRCRQRLSVNYAGKIVRIVHEELPGERERLDEFLRRCGISR
jgi:hypothetical protein